ncbi:MAG: hypothetical protein LBQ14_07955 [Treponema sp.]|jgi:hypothetical protein|nr:hypothetical protein [Treponema sp.]
MSAELASILSNSSDGLIGSVLTVIVSIIVARTKSKGIRKELKAAKAEIQNLKKYLDESTINPLRLKDGIYYDSDGNPYCAACYGSPYERIPLKVINQQGAWTLYYCPKCHEQYPDGTSPPSNPKHYSILDDS